MNIISTKEGCHVERFKGGKDGGKDGKFFSFGGNEIVIQCKHWLKSGIKPLIRHLKTQELDEIQKPEIEKLKEELKSYFDPYDDNWRDSFDVLTTFSSDNSLPSFTKEHLNQLFKDKTFKSILLLNHTASIVDEFKVIEREEIFNIAIAEYNISDDDKKKYEEYEKKYKAYNGIDIKHIIYDMLKSKISAPPREELPQTSTRPSSASELSSRNVARC